MPTIASLSRRCNVVNRPDSFFLRLMGKGTSTTTTALQPWYGRGMIKMMMMSSSSSSSSSSVSTPSEVIFPRGPALTSLNEHFHPTEDHFTLRDMLRDYVKREVSLERSYTDSWFHLFVEWDI